MIVIENLYSSRATACLPASVHGSPGYFEARCCSISCFWLSFSNISLSRCVSVCARRQTAFLYLYKTYLILICMRLFLSLPHSFRQNEFLVITKQSKKESIKRNEQNVLLLLKSNNNGCESEWRASAVLCCVRGEMPFSLPNSIVYNVYCSPFKCLTNFQFSFFLASSFVILFF